ncbi:hypothetical protein TSH100_12695 [Azospirillum sp. TSH100]|nr:hypothetical protein TSH100_12695 [Azospirillum sp. TSH100]
MPNEASALTLLCDRLVRALAPLEIRLFGSRATGSATSDSDFDLLVIFPDNRGEAALDYDAAYAPVRGLGIGCDVVPCLLGDYEAERDIPGTLPYVAAQGRQLYRQPTGGQQ